MANYDKIYRYLQNIASHRNKINDTIHDFWGTLHQLMQPSEWRIVMPVDARDSKETAAPEHLKAEEALPDELISEMGTCLWYIKTRYFGEDWERPLGGGDGRARRALRQIDRAIDAMQAANIVVEDPTGKRYPEGGEHMMEPLEKVKTEGVIFPTVSKAVAPIIYRGGLMVQRARVFVATPKEQAVPAEPHDTTDTYNAPKLETTSAEKIEAPSVSQVPEDAVSSIGAGPAERSDGAPTGDFGTDAQPIEPTVVVPEGSSAESAAVPQVPASAHAGAATDPSAEPTAGDAGRGGVSSAPAEEPAQSQEAPAKKTKSRKPATARKPRANSKSATAPKPKVSGAKRPPRRRTKKDD